MKAVPTGLYTYPDLLIVCGPVERDPLNPNTITNPVVVLEVLSPSTEHYDRGIKFRHYQKIPSVQEIVFVSQDEAVVEIYTRHIEGEWRFRTFDDPEGTFQLTSVSIEVPLADVYRGMPKPSDEPANREANESETS